VKGGKWKVEGRIFMTSDWRLEKRSLYILVIASRIRAKRSALGSQDCVGQGSPRNDRLFPGFPGLATPQVNSQFPILNPDALVHF